ncbi:hypothetical protein V6N13_049129 [Hibiscus sabdariffa]|uniref:Uncharacterized protein n=1 Tax=Hibiscus sabdariffa TaxID=183260 RepID=A0ABR2QY75_9ROSI
MARAASRRRYIPGVDLAPVRPRFNKPLPPFRSPQPRLCGVSMLGSTVANDEGVPPSTLSHSLINSAKDWIWVVSVDGSIEVWNEVLDSDVEEMRVLKVSFDEEFRGLIQWWFGSAKGWVVSHVLGYRAVTESLRADDRVRLFGKEMGLCGVDMELDGRW